MASKDDIELIVRIRTQPASRHQDAALEMLDSHYKRFKAEIKTIVCVCCGDTVKDCVRWTQDGKITDSWGYTEDVDGDTCFRCDGGSGFIDDIYGGAKTN